MFDAIADDFGWVAKERYIGRSGQHVSPRLYVAIGISGPATAAASSTSPSGAYPVPVTLCTRSWLGSDHRTAHPVTTFASRSRSPACSLPVRSCDRAQVAAPDRE